MEINVLREVKIVVSRVLVLFMCIFFILKDNEIEIVLKLEERVNNSEDK